MVDNLLGKYMFLFIGLLVASTIAEGILWLSWSKRYFSKGIVIYRKEVESNNKVNSISKDNLIKNIKIINFTFKQTDNNTIFFREKLFIFKLSPVWELVNYIPIMRGMLKLDTNNKYIVTGFLNYDILTILVIFPILSIYTSLLTDANELLFFFFLLMILFIAILAFTYYVLQLPKYNKIARYLENKNL